jgi:hypothetical protein
MADVERAREELTRRIQQFLRESGIEAEVDLTEHDAVIHGQLEREGEPLRVTVHITDRRVVPRGHGTADRELARARLETAVIRPTLAERSAASGAAEQRYRSD